MPYSQLCFSLVAFLLLLPLIARADIAVIVHPDNPLASLSETELKKIFLGRLALFPHSQDPIRAVDLPEEDPTFIQFYRRVVQLEGAKLKRYRAYYLFSGRGQLPLQVDSTEEMLAKIAADNTRIGYVDSEAVNGSVKVLLVLPYTDAIGGETHEKNDAK